VCCFLALTVDDTVHKLQVSLLALVLVSAAGVVWLRRDQQVPVR
jgi:cell division protein FtsL